MGAGDHIKGNLTNWVSGGIRRAEPSKRLGRDLKGEEGAGGKEYRMINLYRQTKRGQR